MNLRDVAIGALAHAIRLGKRPRPGMVMGGNISIDVIDQETGKLTEGEKRPVEFLVTEGLLAAAVDAINAQDVTYREPKTSVLHYGNAVPDAVWNVGKKKAN